ncbi:MAG: hypothetical protein LBT09_00725 [Planctomycetaceae bacterium]|jgi:hypothetical protein|nr:hypothetical protein [Planctomycetaceae bacterium]
MKNFFSLSITDSLRFSTIINLALSIAVLFLMTTANYLFAQQTAFPIERLHTDWLYQDFGLKVSDCFTSADKNDAETKILAKVIADLEKLGAKKEAESFNAKFKQLTDQKLSGKDPQWKSLYIEAANLRRVKRLAVLTQKFPQLVYTKHCVLGGSHYAYTENVTDAQMPERTRTNRDWRVGAALCLLKINADGTVTSDILHETKTGILRDPDVSYDGKKILFSMRQNDSNDDFHLYEYDIASKKVKQLTHGTGFADIEPCYLPNGNILFTSTRCTQIVDCWWTEVSNFYLTDNEGRFMRRIGFDQVHSNYPTTTEDGRVLYTRWDYNDRGQLYPQPLFQMNYDGTAQTEFYGNNSWFPTTILHARMIPGSQKVIAIASGHHTHQRGKLIVIDRSKGTQEAEGVQLVAPRQETKSVHVDQYGQGGEQFQYPYPIDETHFLVTYQPEGVRGNSYGIPFGVYLTDIDGNRELLAFDPSISSCQQIPLAQRKIPTLRASAVDYTKETGQYYVQDIYEGPGLKGVERGTVKSIRVVALEFRAAGIHSNGNNGVAGSAVVSTPVAIDNGTWDVKRVIGNVPVEKDGSAFFEVPARTPLYFQMLDAKGKVVQTMRSWSTLQPGELFSCIGCHENKNETAFVRGTVTPISKLALRRAPNKPVPLIASDRGFSFPLDVQPILNKNCVGCHKGEGHKLADGSAAPFSLQEKRYEPKPREGYNRGGRDFSEAYINLVKKGRPNAIVNWMNVQSIPPMILPSTPDSPMFSSNHYTGSTKSKLISNLESGHHDVKLSPREMEILACWIDLAVPYCGSYTEANIWNDDQRAEYAYYLNKRNRMEEFEKDNIKKLIEFNKTSILPETSVFRTPDVGGINAKNSFKKSFLEELKKNKN